MRPITETTFAFAAKPRPKVRSRRVDLFLATYFILTAVLAFSVGFQYGVNLAKTDVMEQIKENEK